MIKIATITGVHCYGAIPPYDFADVYIAPGVDILKHSYFSELNLKFDWIEAQLAFFILMKAIMAYIKEALNKSGRDLSRPLVPDLPAAGRRGSTTYIPVGESVQDLVQTQLASKSMTDFIARLSDFRAAHPCAT